MISQLPEFLQKAQNGYNYDRPDSGIGGGGYQAPTGSQGYPAAATTPTYAAPSFPPNQAPGGGYNYPQGENDFPTGPAGTTGYPSQRPSSPSGFTPQGGAAAGQPYPGAQAPSAGAGYPGAQAPSAGQPYPGAQAPSAGAGYPGAQTGGAQYPTPGQSQSIRPTGPAAAAGNRPAGNQAGFGGSPQAPAPGGFAGQGSQGGVSGGSSSSSQQDESQEGDYSAIPGEPEIDYPIFSEIPETAFDCNQQEFPGYYADVEARCQVFHICALNKTFDFLCPNGTIFSQESLVCVWWNQFDCNSAPGLFGNNANLYDNTQTGQQGGQAQAQGGQAQNDFVGTAGGRPQTVAPGFGGGVAGPATTGQQYPAGPSSYQPTAPAGGASYPGAAQAGPTGPYPGPTGVAGGYQPSGPAQGSYPSTQGPYPGAGVVPPSNVPSSYQPPQGFPPQADAPYPAAGTPQTPTREYLPPRRG